MKLAESKPEPRTPPAPAAPETIRLEGVSVEYVVPRERITSLKEYAIRLVQRRVEHVHFAALRDVSFTVGAGEAFGVIGHNGAGKSTLLKLVSRVMKPTAGRVWVRGHIAPLLELGAGFHGELSGRENVFLNGTLLGHTHDEIEEMFDEIVAFAELGDFIDAPIRTYSTGMTARLGFAVATALRPDVLLVDEVLSVGDESFQQKCTERMERFRAHGTTILIVTHDSSFIRDFCDRAVLLHHGVVRALGDPAEVVDEYHRLLYGNPPAAVADEAEGVAAGPPESDLEPHELELLALQKQWFYRFTLPSGRRTECLLPDEVAAVHDTRWAMISSVLNPLLADEWAQTTCLDIGCNQGYFAFEMARRGCRDVLGIDARGENIADAELIRQIYGLSNLRFETLEALSLNVETTGRFDVVLLLSLVFQTDNPIGMLRRAKALADRVVLVETQLAPDLDGMIEWGSNTSFKPLLGSFAVIDQSADIWHPVSGITGLILCPGRAALVGIMQKLGFRRVEVVEPPPDAYEQFASGKRIVVAGYV